jgi:hypothetical protein
MGNGYRDPTFELAYANLERAKRKKAQGWDVPKILRLQRKRRFQLAKVMRK